MQRDIVLGDSRTTSDSELFTQYLSDIILEIERIKVKGIRNDTNGIMDHVLRINSSLLGMVDAKLELAEIYERIRN